MFPDMPSRAWPSRRLLRTYADGTYADGQPGISRERGRPDRDEQTRYFGTEFCRVTGRWVGREPAGVLLVHAREVGRIAEQYANFDDIVEARAAWAKG